MIAPMKESKPAVIKMQETEIAKDAIAKSLAFCS
jgi:hypothetical protein